MMVELIKNTKEEGKIFVNKLSAAERQLSAAIRMYFMEEDQLAVHTVASAALNLYADLMKFRGKEPALYGGIYGVLRAARDVLDGEFSLDHFDSWGVEGRKLIQDMVEFLGANPEIDIEAIRVNGPDSFVRQYWTEKRKAYNFLKHADRDRDGLLDEADVNNENIIVEAIGNALHLNCKMTPDKEFFISAMYAMDFLSDPPSDPMLIWILKQLSADEIMSLARRNLCYSRVNDDFEIDLDSKSDLATKNYLERLSKP